MRIITAIDQANALLTSYSGATFQIKMYTESLKRIAIRLTLHDHDEIIYLVGVGCERMSGKFNLSEVFMSISTTSDGLTQIRDDISDFKLITSGGFSLAQGIEADFGTSFENFLLDC